MIAPPPSRRPARARIRADEAGVTLVELMVSMVLLSIILAAAAASLITFTRTAADNERRVQATAVMNALHEEFHTAAWDSMGMYEDELGELIAEGLVVDNAGVYEDADGNPLVVLADLGTATRDPAVPDPSYTDDISDREYTVRQFISWQDRSGVEDAAQVHYETKRMTTIVSWSLLGRTYTERFDSERAATPDEIGDPTRPRVIQFLAGPKTSELDADELTTEAINISVRFSQPVSSAILTFYALDASDQLVLLDETDEIALVPEITTGGGSLSFSGSIPVGTFRFPQGSRTLRVIGSEGGDTFTGYASVSFAGGDIPPMVDPDAEDTGPVVPEDPDDDGGITPPATPVEIVGTPTVSSPSVCLTSGKALVQTLTISAFVKGLVPSDYQVTAIYDSKNKSVQGEMVPVGTPLESGSFYELTFLAGAKPGFSGGDQTSFGVEALRPQSDDDHDGPATSPVVTFLAHNAPGC